MNPKYFFTLLLFSLIQVAFHCQKKTNISFKSITQVGSNVSIDYKVKTKWYIKNHTSLYVKEKGNQRWQGPLNFVVGDLGSYTKSGKNNILWEVTKSRNELLGECVFGIDNSMTIKNNIKNLRKRSTFCSLVGLGIGGYYLYKSESYYNQYQSATTNAASLRKKDEEMLNMSIFGLSIGTILLIERINLGRKIKKIKKQIFK